MKYDYFSPGDFFKISTTSSFNKDKLTIPSKDNCYDYVTRTFRNNGVEHKTGFVNENNLNDPNTISLGLMQMSFFYRPIPWYAGQFVRIIEPIKPLDEDVMLYFVTIFQKMSPSFKKVIVRHINDFFYSQKLYLPVYDDGNVNFEEMKKIINDNKSKVLNDIKDELGINK